MTLRIPPWLALAVCTIAGFVALYLGWGRAFVANDRCLDDGGRYEERWDTCLMVRKAGDRKSVV